MHQNAVHWIEYWFLAFSCYWKEHLHVHCLHKKTLFIPNIFIYLFFFFSFNTVTGPLLFASLPLAPDLGIGGDKTNKHFLVEVTVCCGSWILFQETCFPCIRGIFFFLSFFTGSQLRHAGSFVAVEGPLSGCDMCSLVAVCRLNCPVACENLSSPARDQTHIPDIRRWILNHWTTREVPKAFWCTKTHQIWPSPLKLAVSYPS